VLSSKSGNGTSAQPPVEAPSTHILYTSINLRLDSTTKQHFIPIAPVQLAQTLIIMHLKAEGPFDDKTIGPCSRREIEGNDLTTLY